MADVDAEIDELTSSIVHVPSARVYATEIMAFKGLSSGQRRKLAAWRFDWNAENKQPDRHVFGLVTERAGPLQGLISIQPDQGFVFVHLIDSAPHNVGQNKLHRGVPGNLFAFACSRSFDLGYDGFVAFHAKTELIEHYQLSLGARQIGSSPRMIIATAPAFELVQRYYSETDRWPL